MTTCGQRFEARSLTCREFQDRENAFLQAFSPSFPGRDLCAKLEHVVAYQRPEEKWTTSWEEEVSGLTWCTGSQGQSSWPTIEFASGPHALEYLMHEQVHAAGECPWRNLAHEGWAPFMKLLKENN